MSFAAWRCLLRGIAASVKRVREGDAASSAAFKVGVWFLNLGKLASLAMLLICLGAIAGCSIPDREPGVPQADTARVLPLGIANARFLADGDPKAMMEEGTRAVEREQAALRSAGKPTTRLPPVDYLAVSGGGDNGAFGAGLLNGWTETGKRPEFKMVTGVSTGALIAPFAFLGPDYDAGYRQARDGQPWHKTPPGLEEVGKP
jgi:hypothetical protein